MSSYVYKAYQTASIQSPALGNGSASSAATVIITISLFGSCYCSSALGWKLRVCWDMSRYRAALPPEPGVGPGA